MVNQILLGLVESVLGKSNPTARGNHAFHCAFCHHKNPKLEINLIPNKKKENLWHCWVCDKKGKTLFGLFKALKVSNNKRTQLKDILGTTEKYDIVVSNTKVELPPVLGIVKVLVAPAECAAPIMIWPWLFCSQLN